MGVSRDYVGITFPSSLPITRKDTCKNDGLRSWGD